MYICTNRNHLQSHLPFLETFCQMQQIHHLFQRTAYRERERVLVLVRSTAVSISISCLLKYITCSCMSSKTTYSNCYTEQ